MDGQTLIELLTPLIGKRGTIFVETKDNHGQLGDEKHPLQSVSLRADGWIHTTSDRGWAVFNPAEIVVVSWKADQSESAGTYL